MDAFDADVLIYAATPGHALGRRVAARFESDDFVGIGSTLLLPELLTRPARENRGEELDALAYFLGRLDLRPVDVATAELAVVLGAAHRLRAADAVHLATAVIVGADRFITNNRRDFDAAAIDEIDVTYPAGLDDEAD